MVFAGSTEYLQAWPICYGVNFRPSDQLALLNCYGGNGNNYLYLVAPLNGTNLKTIAVATTSQGATKDNTFANVPDPVLEDVYFVGRAFGTWPGEQAINANGQVLLVKVYQNFTLAGIRLFGAAGVASSAYSVAFSQLSNQIFVTGSTSASLDGQPYSAASDTFTVAYFASNFTRAWSRMAGSTGSDTGFSVTDYNGGCISTGYWFSGASDRAWVQMYSSNGTSVWQNLLTETVTNYGDVQVYNNDGFVYNTGSITGTIDGKASGGATADMILTRHFLVNGTRDKTWSVVFGQSTIGETGWKSSFDSVTGMVAVSGWASTPAAIIVYLWTNGTVINYVTDTIGSSQNRGNALTTSGILLFNGYEGSTGFLAVDKNTFARKAVSLKLTTTTATITTATTTSTTAGTTVAVTLTATPTLTSTNSEFPTSSTVASTNTMTSAATSSTFLTTSSPSTTTSVFFTTSSTQSTTGATVSTSNMTSTSSTVISKSLATSSTSSATVSASSTTPASASMTSNNLATSSTQSTTSATVSASSTTSASVTMTNNSQATSSTPQTSSSTLLSSNVLPSSSRSIMSTSNTESTLASTNITAQSTISTSGIYPISAAVPVTSSFSTNLVTQSYILSSTKSTTGASSNLSAQSMSLSLPTPTSTFGAATTTLESFATSLSRAVSSDAGSSVSASINQFSRGLVSTSLAKHISTNNVVASIGTMTDSKSFDYDYASIGAISIDLERTFVQSTFVSSVNVDSRQFTAQSAGLPISLIAAVLGTAFLICGGALAYLYVTLKSKRITKRMNGATDTETAYASNTVTSISTVSAGGRSQSANTNMTAIVTQHELSVPLFLLTEYLTTFSTGKVLARGGMGVVSLAHAYEGSELLLRSRGVPLVAKVAEQAVEFMSDAYKQAFFQELSLHHLFRDTPNVARVFGYSESPYATIIMSLYPLGSMSDYIEAKGGAHHVYKYLKWQVLSLMKDCSEAYRVIHARGVAHCEIKPANVLLQSVNGQLRPAVTDFGVARVLADHQKLVLAFKTSTISGMSLQYASPESIERVRNTATKSVYEAEVWKRGDVFSFAMMLKEALTRKLPWAA